MMNGDKQIVLPDAPAEDTAAAERMAERMQLINARIGKKVRVIAKGGAIEMAKLMHHEGALRQIPKADLVRALETLYADALAAATQHMCSESARFLRGEGAGAAKDTPAS